MFRSPRTRFAASFVTVVAGGCSHDAQPDPRPIAAGSARVALRTWYVQHDDNGCYVNAQHAPMHCPQGARCNPPPPRRIAITCPPKHVEEIVETKPHACELDIEPRGQKVACPE